MVTLYVTRQQPEASHQVVGLADDGKASIRAGLTAAQVRGALSGLRPGTDFAVHPGTRNILADILATDRR